MDKQEVINPEGPKKDGRGGARDNSGRKKADFTAYKNMADEAFDFVERMLVNNAKGADNWKSTPEEKKKITNALTEVLKDFHITAIENPYATLFFSSLLYTFGKGRLTPKDAGNGFKSMFKSIKEKWTKKESE